MKKRVLLIDDEFGTIQEFKSVFIKPLNHEYLERIVDDNHFFDERKEVYLNKLLHEIGIPSHLIGYTYIKAGISSISKNHDGSIKIKKLYHKISEKFSTNNSCVERAIRHAIETSWSRGNLQLIDELFGYSISASKDKPTNIEFMKTLSDKIKEKEYH